ncbi:MAG TPA: 6-pyruvoyl-tetrahydropterin synthase-related protein [Acidimicrobiales bacterium]|nr:6-pyruvoyl-tetrahydropterin synthase-related protein [Acidimicrobiales bacterium]
MRRPRASTVATVIAVAGLVAFVFWQFDPSLLLSTTTTAGGDTGAHVAYPAFMRDHLLPHFRLTGWDPGAYDGFPAFTFYFPLPSLIVVALSVVIPYAVAFKLVTAAGSLALPVAAWAMGRMWGMSGAGPVFLSAGSVLYLFDRSYTIYGGNIPSTLAGEYAFSLSLAVGLVFLGVVGRGVRSRRRAAWAAVLLAVTGLCHLLPTLFVLVGAVVALAMAVVTDRRPVARRAAWATAVVICGGLLAGFWWIPFALRLRFTTDMGWVKITSYLHTLVPAGSRWLAVAAAVGVVASLAARLRIGVFLTIMGALSAAGFVLAPQGKIWNARLLPFWVLCEYLLAAVAAYVVADGAARLLARWLRPSPTAKDVVLAPVAALVAVVVAGVPLGVVPFGGAATSFIPSWVKWNYSGYQAKASWPEYSSVINTMNGIGATYGCGRAMWEYESEQNRFGTPEALMLLPYWTNGCIDSMEGLLFESASTTPYHFINQSELSMAPSDAMLGLSYPGLNLAQGIAHLQMLGVRYYMAFSPQIEAEAAHIPALHLLAHSGPWPDQYTTGTKDITWDIYEVADSSVVAPLSNLPAVLASPPKSSSAWLSMAQRWYLDPNRWPVLVSAGGPPSWPRITVDGTAPRVALPPVNVSGVRTGDDWVSFDVDRTGVPVEVKVSYFPNWQASGATGPWRVTPNLMVVVPTSKHVTLHYGWTPVDGLGLAASAAGVAGVVLLARRPVFPADPPAPLLVPSPQAEADEEENELVGASAGDPEPGPPA